jgi:glycosyltransferase involved in cell wall biosynthesis
MRRLLLITAFPPSRFSAGQNYTLNLLDDLASRYHVDLVYFNYRDQHYNPTHPNISVVAAVPLSPLNRILNFFRLPFFHPAISSRFSPKVLRRLKDLIARNSYAVVFFDFTQVFIYNYFIKHPNKVMMAHDVLAQKYSRQSFALEKKWVYQSERKVMAEGRLQTFSQKDQALVKELYGRNSEVVHFYLSKRIVDMDLQSLQQEDYFCFFGAWNRPENSEGLRWFIQEVLPNVNGAKYKIVGANLPEDIRVLIDGHPRISYVGFVDDPYVVIARSRALIAPLFRGAGIKVKVIESLCCGTPVLGTSIAIEGIPDVAGNIIRCEDASEFVAALMSFDIPSDRKVAFRNLFLKYYDNAQKTIV